jgi:hypothetical protein
LPDVIIVADSVKYTPTQPKSGDAVTFKATIKNVGTVPTPAGTIHGVAFRVNGTIVSWSDSSTQSLAAGESRELTANGGPNGIATWLAVQGNYDVTAIWDNAQRIAETNEQNNNSISSIVVTTGTLPPVVIPPALATVSLTSGTNVLINSPTSVDVKINSNGLLLKTASIRILYDPTKLDYVSVTDTGSAFTGGGIPTYNEPGLVEINRFSINGVTGNNLQFAKINFISKFTTGATSLTVGPSFIYQNTTSNDFNLSGSTNTQINIIRPTDSTPPTSQINTDLSSLVTTPNKTIAVTATDNVAIARVALEIVGGPEIATKTTSPYNLVLNSRALQNGNYQLRAVSYDTAGNKTASSPVQVKVRLADINRSGTVEIGDLTTLIATWNQNNPSNPTNVANDLDDDGIIGIGDLTKIISTWGQ